MCRFKSGLILKNRCVIAEGANDSHIDLLESLGIEDNIENAMRVFVRVELLPPNEEWWTDPDTWNENVDQDILPEWFENDKDRYFDEFRKAVKDWWKEHVRIDEKIEELSSGYYRLKRCKVKNMLKDVKAMLDNSTVQYMWDNSTVQYMWDNSTVQNMRGNSTVQNMRGNSTVQNMRDNSTVQNMRGNSIARDSKNKKIKISSECDYKIVKEENKKS